MFLPIHLGCDCNSKKFVIWCILLEMTCQWFYDVTVNVTRNHQRWLITREGTKDSHSIRFPSKCVIFEPKPFDSIRIRINQPSNVSVHNSCYSKTSIYVLNFLFSDIGGWQIREVGHFVSAVLIPSRRVSLSFMDFTIIIPSRMYLQLSQIDW